MFEIGTVTHFEAAHRLSGDFGPATETHWHNYRIEIAVRGTGLDGDGTLCDVSRVQQAAQSVVSGLHYRDLSEIDGLRGRNTTAEVVAQYLFEQMGPQIRRPGIASLFVRVWESPEVYASYEGALD